MSKYTNYNKVCKTYDDTRYAMGVEGMANILSGIMKKDLQQVSMLDAGCGTGNYSLGFLQQGVGSLTMIDASEGMLTCAKGKVKDYMNNVKEVKQHELPTLPFPDNSFDVVIFMQVLHHLDKHHMNIDFAKLDAIDQGQQIDCVSNGVDHLVTVKERYENLSKAIKEAFRVLKPQGVLMMDLAFQCNLNANWISLAPKALSLCKALYMPEADLLDLLEDEGFKDIFCVTRPGVALSSDGVNNNPEKLLDEHWRGNISVWSIAERTGELQGVLEFMQKHKDEGTLNEFARQKNKAFRIVGESTTVFSRKL